MAHDTANSASTASSTIDDARILALTRPHKNLVVQYLCRSLLTLFAAPFVFVPLYFKYHTLRYRLDDEGLSVSWGILFKREVHLTYKRIQDIHVSRSLVERYLGLGTVEVQTASGSSQAEMQLEGLEHFDAMREFLYRRMRGHEVAPKSQSAATASSDEALVLLRAIQGELEATRRALEPRA